MKQTEGQSNQTKQLNMETKKIWKQTKTETK